MSLNEKHSFHCTESSNAEVAQRTQGADDERRHFASCRTVGTCIKPRVLHTGPRSSAPAASGSRIYATLSAPPYPLAAAGPGTGPSSPALAGDDGRASDRSALVDPQVSAVVGTRIASLCPQIWQDVRDWRARMRAVLCIRLH